MTSSTDWIAIASLIVTTITLIVAVAQTVPIYKSWSIGTQQTIRKISLGLSVGIAGYVIGVFFPMTFNDRGAFDAVEGTQEWSNESHYPRVTADESGISGVFVSPMENTLTPFSKSGLKPDVFKQICKPTEAQRKAPRTKGEIAKYSAMRRQYC